MRTFSASCLALVAACASAPAPVPEPTSQTAPSTPPIPAPNAPAAALGPHDQYTTECQGALAAARTLRDQVIRAQDHTVETTLVPYNELLIQLTGALNRSELFAAVHSDEDMRAAAEECTKSAAKLNSELLLDRGLYDALQAVPTDGLDADTKRFVTQLLRDFHRAGVDKDAATRARLKALSEQVVAIGLEFDKNIREDVRRVDFEPAELDGLPKDYIAAHAPGPDGKVTITTDYPDFLPFRTYAKSSAARKRMYGAYLNRGYPQNDAVLRRLLTARREMAMLLGYPTWADYVTEDKMVKTAQNARAFIDTITQVADRRAKADVAALLKRKRKDEPTAKQVFDYERAFYEELVKKGDYDFDAQSVRPYFDFVQTRDGLLLLTSRLFGVEYRKVTDAEVWHSDVDVYDVYQTGQKLGRIYLDLHPRANKYKHAAQFALRAGVAGKQLPEGVLVCNFPDPRTATGPALMDHADVVTMFHEFGHLMHHILAGKQRWIYFSGTATEQDFVEAPSQTLEEWAWDPATLALFAKHIATHEPIPTELVKRMRRANEFGKGTYARIQMFYAATSLGLHEVDPTHVDLEQLVAETQKKYSMFPHIEGEHMYASFDHLNGYSAVYYAYMWSLVIAKDLFSEFAKHGLLDDETARRYRDRILAPGGSKDAADLVKDFLGRPYSFDAYQRWLDR